MINHDSHNASMTFMPRMTFSMVGNYLGKTDHRAIKRWCKNHDVFYSKDEDGKSYYVIQQEFLYKANYEAEKAMRDKYGENWEKKLTAPAQSEVNEETITHLNKNKYKPQTSEAEQFAQKWSHL